MRERGGGGGEGVTKHEKKPAAFVSSHSWSIEKSEKKKKNWNSGIVEAFQYIPFVSHLSHTNKKNAFNSRASIHDVLCLLKEKYTSASLLS